MIRVYSEHRLNEDWFLRSKGFKLMDWPDVQKGAEQSSLGRRYAAERNDRGVSVREFRTTNGVKWVASCSGVGYQGLSMATVEAAFVAAELANWGQS